jgi:2-polyprenyl-3-methyl-5-hydroxy-6-metoxy-1,4-benzoquinol methylase
MLSPARGIFHRTLKFMIEKILRSLRRRLIDAPRGFGHPVPAAAFDAEFRSGHWRLLDSLDEKARYAAPVALIGSCHPRPRLLDAGCGSGRLAASFPPDALASYHGVDLSEEAIRHAHDFAPANSVLQQGDLETWNAPGRYDVIVINEVVGYFHDPVVTLTRLTASLEPGGTLIVSLYRWGNAPAIWRRLATRFKTLHATVVTNPGGDKNWDIRTLTPLPLHTTSGLASPRL